MTRQPEPNHPLTAVRRRGRVTAYTRGASVTMYLGDDPADPSTDPVDAPYLDSYAPQVGDDVVVLENQGDLVVAGALTTSGRARETDTNAGVVDITSEAVVAQLQYEMISGEDYEVIAHIMGAQVTATAAGLTQARVRIGAAGTTGDAEFMRIFQLNSNLLVGQVAAGGATKFYTASSTATLYVSLCAQQVGGSGAYRVNADNGQITCRKA